VIPLGDCRGCAQRGQAIRQHLRSLGARLRPETLLPFLLRNPPRTTTMSESNYKPTGELQGDTKAMPDRGSATGTSGNEVLDGASLDADATNRVGPIGRQTRSDKGDELIEAGDDRDNTRI
jgi:hypothetical protein